MSHLTIVAKIKSKQDNIDKVQKNLLTLIEPTRKEKGCIDYILHQDNEDPLVFIFYENWVTSDDLDAHMQSVHFTSCFQNIKDMFELQVHRLTKIG